MAKTLIRNKVHENAQKKGEALPVTVAIGEDALQSLVEDAVEAHSAEFLSAVGDGRSSLETLLETAGTALQAMIAAIRVRYPEEQYTMSQIVTASAAQSQKNGDFVFQKGLQEGKLHGIVLHTEDEQGN